MLTLTIANVNACSGCSNLLIQAQLISQNGCILFIMHTATVIAVFVISHTLNQHYCDSPTDMAFRRKQAPTVFVQAIPAILCISSRMRTNGIQSWQPCALPSICVAVL